MVVTFAYFVQATKILFDFNQIYRQLERTLTEAAQFAELLLDPPTVLDPESPEPVAPRGGERGAGAACGSPTRATRAPLFDGLDLRIADGERVGLVGRSGGGKTSIARLLLRLMDVDGGRILVGGQDITRLSQADLRGLIAYVPQDPVMFHRTIAENIAFGRPGATAAEIRAAADAAHVTEFVEALPHGFDTLVGERGVKLSGGQRQRVAIARAILRDAPILLLDEATSALDSESEALIQGALWTMMEGRTAIAVAHRLSTVAGMDRLVVLDRGRVVEQGTHAELLASGRRLRQALAAPVRRLPRRVADGVRPRIRSAGRGRDRPARGRRRARRRPTRRASGRRGPAAGRRAEQPVRPRRRGQCVEHERQLQAVARAEPSAAGGGAPREVVGVGPTGPRRCLACACASRRLGPWKTSSFITRVSACPGVASAPARSSSGRGCTAPSIARTWASVTTSTTPVGT